jgi:hypothetical protein
VDHVTTVLHKHGGLVVDLFEVRLPDPGENREGMPALGEEYADDLDRWFGFITKAKHLILDLSPSNGTSFLFTSENKYKLPANQLLGSIMSLLLGHVSLQLPRSDHGCFLGFKALKKLELKRVADLAGDLTAFLSNCPSLECLSITGSFIPHLVVPEVSCCLRFLQVYQCIVESIELHAMGLTTFEYLGHSSPIKLHASSLKLSEAYMHQYWSIYDTVSYFWDELSGPLSYVDRLYLSLNMDTQVWLFS